MTSSNDALGVVSMRGARRWEAGHAWIFRSDVTRSPDAPAGVVRVQDVRGRAIGSALWSPNSEIALRLLDRDPSVAVDAAWWRRRIGAAIARRRGMEADTNAIRLVHGEGDALPGLVVDRYDRWLVVQLLTAGIETMRTDVVDVLVSLTGCAGILGRNDGSVRAREGLPRIVELLHGSVPDDIEVVEHGVRFLAAPRTGQKTGAFLDQRDNRVLVAGVARGRALDLFSYHGSFALHMAKRASTVVAVDSSAAALERGRQNATLNGTANVTFEAQDAFDFLRGAASGDRYDTIVVDPPALAKNRASLTGAIRAYRDLNLRAMRLLAPGGVLFSASCSYHLGKAEFAAMIADAASASGRRIVLRALTAQPADHPELVTHPETGYLKGALVEAQD